MTGVKNPGKTMTVLLRGSNKLVLAEADRSVHDAQCVVRSLVKKRFMIAGGGAAEAEISLKLKEVSKVIPCDERIESQRDLHLSRFDMLCAPTLR